MPMRLNPKLNLTVAAFNIAAIAFISCSVNPRPTSFIGDYATAKEDTTGPVCEHLEDPWSIRICPNMIEAQYFKPADVSAETLEVRLNDSRVLRIGVHPRADAIFLTRAALSTFLLRHYDATNPVAAAELRTFMAANYRRRP